MKWILGILLGFPILIYSQNYIQKIYPSDPNPGTFFGRFVSLQEDFAFISAYQDFENGSASGSLYIYKKTNGIYVQQQKLYPEDGGVEEYFGYSLASYGDWIITGAHHDSDYGASSGKAYILRKNQSNQYDFYQILTAPDAAEADEFGKTVDIYGNFAVSCSYLDDDNGTNSGSVYIYKFDGNKWQFFQKIQANTPVDHSQFGLAMSLYKDKLIVGAPFTKYNNEPVGQAYIFEITGNTWQQTKAISPDELNKNDEFGITVKIIENEAFVGSIKDDDLGTNSGAVYCYKKEKSKWQFQQKLLAPDGESYDGFGIAIEPDKNYIYIGSYFDNDNGENSGSVYIFKKSEENWSYYSKFLPYDSDESDAFGATISCSENEVLVGAYSDDDNGFFSGAAYLFKKEKLLLSNHSVYKKSKINAFPTVFKDILYITNPDNYIYNIEIFDLSGKIVIEKKQIYASKYNLNCDNLNKGIYFLKVKGNKSEKLFKIIKL